MKPNHLIGAPAALLPGLSMKMPLERKDGEGGDTAEIKQTLTTFMTTFEEFKASVKDEIKDAKKVGGEPDPLLVEKTDKMNTALDALKARVDELRLEKARPRIEINGKERELSEDEVTHSKAFDVFMRKGKDEGLRELEAKALSVGSDPDGGYVAPAQFDVAMDRVMSEVSPIRQVAQVMQVSSASFKKPFNLGGAASGWVGESESRPQTDASQLALLEFPVMEMYAMPAVTQSLLDDAAVNIEMWLADEVSITFAETEGAAFVNGNGTNKPRGILSYDKVDNASWAHKKTGYVVSGASGAFLTTAPGDDAKKIIDLVYSLKSGFRQNAGFMMNRSTQAVVRKMIDADGNFIWQPGLQANQPASLAGYGITEAEDFPDIAANSYSIAFGDFRRGYLIVDRIGVRILRDPYTAKPYVLFYTTKRVGGGIQNFDAIKLMKFATT